ncbi:MAG TPA: TPM domain-containing protein [Sphingobacteriaceae bacterium]|nr:TPM domain-containing protein [Sphingobacteriaceae bacterium]
MAISQNTMYFRHLLLYIFLLSTVSVSGQTFPAKPDKLVNDYTNTLSAAEISALEQRLVTFADSTSTQIAVVLIQSLDGYEISDYASRLAHSWGIGEANKDNGVLVLASLGDRKVTIQTGYGVEGALPDAISKRIIENEIKPYFKQGNYFQGLESGTNAIISYTKGEYKSDKKQPASGKSGNKTFFIIIIVIILIIISKRGGRGGGGGQVISSRGAASPFWWLLMGSGMGRSSGGGWGGGSGGFGGSGGGGFGGFGGGGFGGGGASGSW